MKKKTFFIFAGLLIFLNTLYGCASLKNEPVSKTYFDLTIPLSGSDQNSSCQGEALMVKSFFISPVFDSDSLVYRVGQNKYVNDYYNEFISHPAKLITEKITETLCASNHFKPISNNVKQDVIFRLSGKITQLYGDFQDTKNPKSVIEIRMVLEKKIDTVFKTVTAKTYPMEEPILSPTPDRLISGWNLGLEKIVTLFLKDVQISSP